MTILTSLPKCLRMPIIPSAEPRASPSGRTWLVTRKRSCAAMNSDRGVQSGIMEALKNVREGRSRWAYYRREPKAVATGGPVFTDNAWARAATTEEHDPSPRVATSIARSVADKSSQLVKES